MAVEVSTGLLPFIRGADFSHNDFQADKFPRAINQMKGLLWLKMSRSKLDWIPEEFKDLDKLEKLCLSRNGLVSLHGEIICLNNLSYLDCRYNNINQSDIPNELFELKSLKVLDLSHNNLTDAPTNIEDCTSLIVLNLSSNKIKKIRDPIFAKLNKLEELDLSDNKLNALPTTLGRLSNLKVLRINKNPFLDSKFKLIERLKSLEILHLQDTSRDNNNLSPILCSLNNLVELNLSCNKLSRVPEDLSWCKNLKRLNLSENLIQKLPEDFGDHYPNLESLNLSGNQLTELPNSLCKLCNLKRLYINSNMVSFKGLPPALGKLRHLEVLMAAKNLLESIPESIFRCTSLRKLILTSNRLVTLPESIHLLNDLEVLELSNNPDLMMPSKPFNDSKNMEFYNIDFSLNAQLQLAGDTTSIKEAPLTIAKDPMARKLRLRKRAKDDVEQEKKQAKVLEGMQDLAANKDNLNLSSSPGLELNLKPKRWEDALEKPPIDYSDFFDSLAGQIPGLTVWEIENFCPAIMDQDLIGKFYGADSYIVLSTHYDENMLLQWKIFYWIGSECTLDKKACAAIHAVGLRNHLDAQCRTVREEQGEESEEFLELFPEGIEYVKGARTASGFYTVEETKYNPRMFRLHEVAEKTRELHLETVELSSNSLDSRFVFLIDCGYKIFIWNGIRSKNTTKQKARLLGEKLNNEERKNKAEIFYCDQGNETQDLLDQLNLSDTLPKKAFKTVDLSDDFEIDSYYPPRPVLYQVCLGKGFIELIQVQFPTGKLLSKQLLSTNVYILDCLTDVFVWIGRKSSKLGKKAALKLGQEIFGLLKRPNYATITSCCQGTEPQLFKTKFKEWDDVIAVDYTRTVESVMKTGADIKKWMSEQKVKIDLSALFTERKSPVTDEECERIAKELKNELASMDAFVVKKGNSFAVLSADEIGHFYSEDCYVFLPRYYMMDDSSEENSSYEEEPRSSNCHPLVNGNYHLLDSQSPQNDGFRIKAYFWQGREASKMGWLSFTFSLQRKFEDLFGTKLEVILMHQQKEQDLKFLAYFDKKFIIHRGKRLKQVIKEVEFFHLRANNNPLTLRCIEIEPCSSHLNSGFCYILKLNYTVALQNGFTNRHSEARIENEECIVSKVYVWIGRRSNPNEAAAAGEIANNHLRIGNYDQTVVYLQEGDEPEQFWRALGGKKDYDHDAEFMKHTRLFRCSNDRGYFAISEKSTDFCQDDLSDEDIMILDNGSQIFLWIGPNSSEVEVKLAYKSAQVYAQNLKIKQPDKPRQLMLTLKGKETKKFTKSFHAWIH